MFNRPPPPQIKGGPPGAKKKKDPGQKVSNKTLDVRKVNNPDVTAALQNELSKRLEQVDFTKGQTKENWAKFRNEVDTAAKETIDILKRHHQDWLMITILKLGVFLLRSMPHTRTGYRTYSLTQGGTSSTISEEKFRSDCTP
ncbi:hypothetical protein ACOMHN_059933 [Nucella lapillus]